MSEQLKPCPFCGGEAEIREYKDRDIHGYEIGIRYAIGCKDDDCKCLMGVETPLYRKIEDAVKKWNRREGAEHDR